MSDLIPRASYFKKISPFIGKPLIKVITGQRRVGKSYFLQQLIQSFKKDFKDNQVIYINKELHEFSHISNSSELLKHIEEISLKRLKTGLFIDEIQDIENFEFAFRDLVARGNFDIYCTGSNARLLSGELATFLGGRYIEVRMYSLSYPEFLTFHKKENNNESFEDFLKLGGLPFLINLDNQEHVIFEYLAGIYNTIVLKDVVARFNIRNVQFLENLISFLADNVGSIVSAKKISDYLKSQKIKISPQVVLDYLSHLETSYLISKVKRAEIHGKKIFEIGEKYYFEDLGIRNFVSGFYLKDIQKIMENVVFLHLRMAGFQVKIGVDGNKEVDFIGQRSNSKLYIQVAYLLSEEKTIQREYGNLLSIGDNFPKFIVTMDQVSETDNYLGIKVISLKDFCLYIFDF